MPSLYEARRRHALHYSQVAQRNHANFIILNLEMPNILIAANFCEDTQNWQQFANITKGLNDFWFRRALWDKYLTFNSKLLQANNFKQIDERVEIINQLARLEETRGNYTEAHLLYKEIVQTSHQQEIGDIESVTKALRQVSSFAKVQDNDNEALTYLQEGLAIARKHEMLKEEIDLLLEIALIHRRMGEMRLVYSISQRCLELAQSIGYFSTIIDVLVLRASLAVDEHFFKEAYALYRDALDKALYYGDQIRAANIREKLANVGAIFGKQIFISYNHQDRDFAMKLANDLKTMGIAVWWAEWEIKVGDSIIQKVSDGIDRSAYLAVVLSPSSVRSPWVQRELGSALMSQLSVEKNISILPLLLADCDIPALLRGIKWADFRQDYQTGLREILGVVF